MKEKIEVIYCDYCNTKHVIPSVQAISVSVPIGRQLDAAGGTETEFLQFDICPSAAEVLFHILIDKRNMVEWVTDNIPRARKK